MCRSRHGCHRPHDSVSFACLFRLTLLLRPSRRLALVQLHHHQPRFDSQIQISFALFAFSFVSCRHGAVVIVAFGCGAGCAVFCSHLRLPSPPLFIQLLLRRPHLCFFSSAFGADSCQEVGLVKHPKPYSNYLGPYIIVPL